MCDVSQAFVKLAQHDSLAHVFEAMGRPAASANALIHGTWAAYLCCWSRVAAMDPDGMGIILFDNFANALFTQVMRQICSKISPQYQHRSSDCQRQ